MAIRCVWDLIVWIFTCPGENVLQKRKEWESPSFPSFLFSCDWWPLKCGGLTSKTQFPLTGNGIGDCLFLFFFFFPSHLWTQNSFQFTWKTLIVMLASTLDAFYLHRNCFHYVIYNFALLLKIQPSHIFFIRLTPLFWCQDFLFFYSYNAPLGNSNIGDESTTILIIIVI